MLGVVISEVIFESSGNCSVLRGTSVFIWVIVQLNGLPSYLILEQNLMPINIQLLKTTFAPNLVQCLGTIVFTCLKVILVILQPKLLIIHVLIIPSFTQKGLLYLSSSMNMCRVTPISKCCISTSTRVSEITV